MQLIPTKLSLQEYFSDPLWYLQVLPVQTYLFSGYKGLNNEHIGWHCGNWETNCRSIAIAFLDDLEEAEPTPAALNTANGIIRKYNTEFLLGHREIKSSTTCPGNKFLNGWKADLNGKLR